MKSHLHCLSVLLLCVAFSTAEPPGIDQSLELVTPPTGAKFIRWHGKLGRTYFIMVSNPADHLKSWHYAPMMEGGNDVEISYEVESTADKSFFRLLYTDEPTIDPYRADFDGDGLRNSLEVERLGGDPFVKNTVAGDSDGNGLPEAWEIMFTAWLAQFGIPMSNPDPLADYDGDGLTNVEEFMLGTNPFLMDTDGDGIPDESDPDPLAAQVSVTENSFRVLSVIE